MGTLVAIEMRIWLFFIYPLLISGDPTAIFAEDKQGRRQGIGCGRGIISIQKAFYRSISRKWFNLRRGLGSDNF